MSVEAKSRSPESLWGPKRHIEDWRRDSRLASNFPVFFVALSKAERKKKTSRGREKRVLRQRAIRGSGGSRLSPPVLSRVVNGEMSPPHEYDHAEAIHRFRQVLLPRRCREPTAGLTLQLRACAGAGKREERLCLSPQPAKIASVRLWRRGSRPPSRSLRLK